MKKTLLVSAVVCLLLVLVCGTAMAAKPDKALLSRNVRANYLDEPDLYGVSNLWVEENGMEGILHWDADPGDLVTGYVIFQCGHSVDYPENLPYGWCIYYSDDYYWYPVAEIGRTTDTSFKVKAPEAGDYFLEVDSYYLDPEQYVCNHTEVVQFTASNGVSAPATVKAEVKGAKKVQLTWTAGQNATKYEVYRKVGNGNWKKIKATSDLTYTDSKATKGKINYYKIRAKKGSNYSDSEEIGTFPLGKTSSLKGKFSSKKVTLNWKKISGAKSYKIYVQAPGEDGFEALDVTTKVKYTYKPASGNGTYKYYVVGTDASGEYEGMASKKVSVKVKGLTSNTVYRALIVANSYAGTGSMLNGTAHDAVAVEGALKTLTQGWKVNVQRNVTGSEILSAIDSTFSGSDGDDVCLFYYSGHGVTSSGTYSGALCGNDLNSYVTTSQLASALNSACGGKVIVMLDSCGSGAGIDDRDAGDPKVFTQAVINAFATLDKLQTPKYGELMTSKFHVIAAAATGTSSYDTSVDGNPCGAFSFSWLKTMGSAYPNGAYTGSMPGDTNGDKQLTLLETYNGIRSVVSEYGWDSGVNQHTQYYGNNSFVMFTRK